MITQSALNSLDPVHKVGDQIVEALQTHETMDRTTAKQRVEEMFAWWGSTANDSGSISSVQRA